MWLFRRKEEPEEVPWQNQTDEVFDKFTKGQMQKMLLLCWAEEYQEVVNEWIGAYKDKYWPYYWAYTRLDKKMQDGIKPLLVKAYRRMK